MTKQIPLPDGSKKIDVTTNALAEALACVKRDREAKKKARVDYPDQGTSGSRDDENLIDEKKKKPTRRGRLPKSIPVRRSKSAQKPPPKTAVVTPVVSAVVGTSVVSTTAPTSTHTTSTHTTSTALPPSPPKSQSPPVKRQKTAVVKTSAVKTTVVGTPVVSTAVSLSQTTATTTTFPSKTSSVPPQIKRRRLIHKDDVSSPSQTSSTSLALVNIPKPVPLSSVPMHKPLPPAGVQFPLELEAVREEIKSFYTEDDPAKRSLPSIKGYPWPKNIDEYLKLKAKQAEDISKETHKGNLTKKFQDTTNICSHKSVP
ncbi:hypothetical protein HanRHA438_Chr02g0047001 [Helianthus annuus]|nr:hypothetical protein HanRHA438_Chr02g0047001 [Helianthus annuus]